MKAIVQKRGVFHLGHMTPSFRLLCTDCHLPGISSSWLSNIWLWFTNLNWFAALWTWWLCLSASRDGGQVSGGDSLSLSLCLSVSPGQPVVTEIVPSARSYYIYILYVTFIM